MEWKEEVSLKCYHHGEALEREGEFNLSTSKADFFVFSFLYIWTSERIKWQSNWYSSFSQQHLKLEPLCSEKLMAVSIRLWNR